MSTKPRSFLLPTDWQGDYEAALSANQCNVLIVSHPKSGRTWLRMMLHNMHIINVCGHHHVHQNPASLKAIDVVFIYRDPRDTVVSFYFHQRKRERTYSGSLSGFIRDAGLGIEQIIRFNRDWLAQGPVATRNFYALRYEDLQSDTRGALRRLAGHFRFDVTDAAIDKAVARFTFEKMQAREAANEYGNEMSGTMSAADLADPDSFKVRRGKVGGYRDYLDERDLAFCAQVMEKYHVATAA